MLPLCGPVTNGSNSMKIVHRCFGASCVMLVKQVDVAGTEAKLPDNDEPVNVIVGPPSFAGFSSVIFLGTLAALTCTLPNRIECGSTFNATGTGVGVGVGVEVGVGVGVGVGLGVGVGVGVAVGVGVGIVPVELMSNLPTAKSVVSPCATLVRLITIPLILAPDVSVTPR